MTPRVVWAPTLAPVLGPSEELGGLFLSFNHRRTSTRHKAISVAVTASPLVKDTSGTSYTLVQTKPGCSL